MNVYCYYENAGEDASRLIPLWSESWHKHGWTPRVLCRDDAKQSIFYNDVLKVVENVPTVNLRDYSTINFIRYCALQAVGGGLFTDYDNINYWLEPDHLWHITKYNDWLRLFHGGFTWFSQTGIDRFCRSLADPNIVLSSVWVLRGQLHVSDVCVMNHLNLQVRPGFSVLYREYGWKTAPTVHYSNDSVAGFGDKAELISKVRPI